MSKIIQQTVTFNASPHEVYEALMDSEKHAAFTGGKAEISRAVGGSIMAYDDYIAGKNIELVPDRKIVQDWRASDWPAGYFSRITFELTAVPDRHPPGFHPYGCPGRHRRGIHPGLDRQLLGADEGFF